MRWDFLDRAVFLPNPVVSSSPHQYGYDRTNVPAQVLTENVLCAQCNPQPLVTWPWRQTPLKYGETKFLLIAPSHKLFFDALLEKHSLRYTLGDFAGIRH